MQMTMAAQRHEAATRAARALQASTAAEFQDFKIQSRRGAALRMMRLVVARRTRGRALATALSALRVGLAQHRRNTELFLLERASAEQAPNPNPEP